MPRGDKKAIMEYEVPKLSYKEQGKIAGILEMIDEKIELNTKVNKNLAAKSPVWKHQAHRTLVSAAKNL